jgi:hypothetical protein
MPKPIRFADRSLPNVERAKFTTSDHRAQMGKSSLVIHCPFCQASILTYLWSLAGGGKRCECGALFGSGGEAFRWAQDHTIRTEEDQ